MFGNSELKSRIEALEYKFDALDQFARNLSTQMKNFIRMVELLQEQIDKVDIVNKLDLKDD